MTDFTDFDPQVLAEQVIDSPEDPIEPRVEMDPEPPDRESRRRNVIADLMDRTKGIPKPEKEKAEKPPKTKRDLPPRRKGSLVKRLTEFYTFLGMSLMAFDQNCGAAIVNSAEKCAEAVDNLAYENDAVRRAVHALLETSAWGQVAMAHMPIMLAIAVHHVPAARNAMAKMAGVQAANETEQWLQNGNGGVPEE